MPLFIRRFLNLPIGFRLFHGAITPSDRDSLPLKGDPSMPPTRFSTVWCPDWVNDLRWLYLSKCVWKVGTVLVVEPEKVHLGYRVGWREEESGIFLLPKVMTTECFVIRHGKERKIFVLIDLDGRSLEFYPVTRGTFSLV